MDNEVDEFARAIGAEDLKPIMDGSMSRGWIKRHNYFLLNNGTLLIIKVSRNQTKPFFGIGKDSIDRFNALTSESGTFFFVGLTSSKSGWILSKQQILSQIANKSLSYSEKQEQYKVNTYNLRDEDFFTSKEDFLSKTAISH